MIADVLNLYAQEHLPRTRAARNSLYNISSLSSWWGLQRVSDITARTCREYAVGRSGAAARRDLEVLRAALNWWHKEHDNSIRLPAITMPPKPEPRDRWLTRMEAAKLLAAGRHTRHLARFILLGLYTGTRPGAILRLRWPQVDLRRGVLHRRPAGEAEDARKRTPPVRLGRKILTHLRRWKRIDDGKAEYVCHYDGKPVQKLRRSWRQAVVRAGLKGKLTPHSLRHTRATWLMQAGIPIWEAAGSLGMTVETLNKVYGHHHPDWQKRASEV